jgi:hypothetical protein
VRTSQPLLKLVPAIIKEWNSRYHERQINFAIYEVINGNLADKVKDSLAGEMISRRAYSQMIQRIPSFNILKRLVDKTSKVYFESVKRYADKKTDQKLVDLFSGVMNLDSQLNVANRYLVAMKSFAIEPYLDNDGNPQIRVLAPMSFMPYSDSILNPNEMTVFVKKLGDDSDGNEILRMSSDNEIIIVNTKGEKLSDLMELSGIASGQNPFDSNPIIYVSATNNQLIPFPNQDGLDMAILMPKLLGDINFASKYLCHSIIYTRNVNIAKIDVNPDAVIDLGDTNQDTNATPEIGTITPTVDIPNLLASIAFQLTNYFDTEGVKSGTVSTPDISGVSKALDDGDISALRKEHIKLFTSVEKKLFALMSHLQARWAVSRNTQIKLTFSDKFIDSFSVAYPEMKALKSDKQRLDEVVTWRDAKLMSRQQAVREMKPEFSDTKVEEWLSEINEEAKENMELMAQGLGSNEPDQKSDGTFTDGNESGANGNSPEAHLGARTDG